MRSFRAPVHGVITLALFTFFSPQWTIAQTVNSTLLPVGSCTADIPCSNGACCNSVSGFCGFGPDFCTTVSDGGPCTSHCDALADCGPYAAPENITCPLNVCCSQYGFCGTTTEFCAAGCQSNCNPPGQMSCGDNQQTALHRRIGYYEGWAVSSDSRACDVYPPEQISAETLTHVNYAFALISDTYQIIEMSPNDRLLWARTTALKKKNASLKVFLSIGGWTFNDPPTEHIFSDLVGSASATQTFIASALSVLQAYSFDGIDIDWEYPVAYERGGVPADKENYPIFMSKVKAAFKTRGYGLTFTAPSSYWYLQHFDLPALLEAADWVNVMTYDLHGTWDSTDPYIGPFVLAHTNLTEIKDTMQLFANVGVNPAQIVLGIGFYGRSFQLTDPACSDPGCPFVGGASQGVCSLNSGTLMFSEIEEIIKGNDLVPTFVEEDAVKYITWNGNQWVSYDDAQTLQMKLDYANSICLGGTMIWSVDQDDSSYTALAALYVDIGINTPSSSETGNMCQITGCGQNCPAGYDSLTTLTNVPSMAGSCSPSSPARLCCPPGDEPQQCVWRGGGGTSCNAQCNVGEIVMALDEVGDDGHPTCVQGYKAFCCQTGLQNPAACFGGSCSASSCASGFTVQTHVKQGSADNGLSCESSPDPKQVCPQICQSNTKPVCCETSAGYSNCEWVGDPPNCLNAACRAGQVAIFSDMQGDASSSCVGNNKRYYCCDPPPNSAFLPVPADWVFPSISPFNSDTYDVNEPATFTVDFDDNTGTTDDSHTGAGSSGIGDDGKENDSAFGEVFISSPNAGSVSSLDIASDWVVANCSATSDEPQEVLAYCSKGLDDEDSGCGHVFIGQAEHTIVRMPASCGLGPYARIASLSVHPDQDSLPEEHRLRKRSSEQVYSLKFDYNFLAVPDSNGPILMRADMTDIPGYWDEIINSAPDSGTTTTKHKRNFHQPHEYHKRWFGPFDAWLAKVTTVRSTNSVDRNFHWSDTYTIFHQEEQCPNFSSSLDVSVSGSAQVTSSFGYYLEATIVPPAVQQCYVFFRAGAQAYAEFAITGLAEAHYDSQRTELATFGFPGLYYPGLLTLGPSLHLYGQLTGYLSLSGQYKASVGYSFPPIDVSFGKQDTNSDEENESGSVSYTGRNYGYDYSVGYNVNLEGSLDAHIVPSLQLGVSVLGGSLIDAQIFAEADLYAGVSINGSVSSSSAAQFCINPHFGVSLDAGVTGSVLYWRPNPLSINFYNNEFPFAEGCFSSMDQGDAYSGGSKRSEGHARYAYEVVAAAGAGSPPELLHDSNSPAYVMVKRDSRNPSIQAPSSSWSVNSITGMQKRGGVPFLPGNLLCPSEGSSISNTQGSDCLCYADPFEDITGQPIDIMSKRSLTSFNSWHGAGNFSGNDTAFESSIVQRDFSDVEGEHLFSRARDTLSNMLVCPGRSIKVPNYQNLPISAYYDLSDPGLLTPEFGDYMPAPLDMGLTSRNKPTIALPNSQPVYAREHVYEVSMAALFIDHLAQHPSVWLNNAQNNAFCDWVGDNLATSVNYLGGSSVFDRVSACYPGGTNGLTTMVALEQMANTYKNRAFAYGESLNNGQSTENLIDINAFEKKWCATKQVSQLRSAAGVPSYLNDFTVRSNFIRDNTCIRNVWTAWYNAYLNSNVDAPNKAVTSVVTLYDTWVRGVVSRISPFIRSEIQNLITTKFTTSSSVSLSFAILLDNAQVSNRQGEPIDAYGAPYETNVHVTATDLTNQVYNAIPDINWLNQLP